jgi:hypothetical protein
VRTVDKTKSPATITVTPDADPRRTAGTSAPAAIRLPPADQRGLRHGSSLEREQPARERAGAAGGASLQIPVHGARRRPEQDRRGFGRGLRQRQDARERVPDRVRFHTRGGERSGFGLESGVLWCLGRGSAGPSKVEDVAGRSFRKTAQVLVSLSLAP